MKVSDLRDGIFFSGCMSFPLDCVDLQNSSKHIKNAAALLRNGELVAFPTETVYGLGANALDETAVMKIFSAKGRPSDNPLIVHVHSLEASREFVSEIDSISEQLARAFWPGPLTIILPLRPGGAAIAKNVSAGLETVGIRVPDHPVALELLREARIPLAAPSANKSGSPSPTTALHVFNDLKSSKEGPSLILDGGPCRVGLESTVVQVQDGIVNILRPGGVSYEDIVVSLGVNPDKVKNSYTVQMQDDEVPRAPGMKYRHYAPAAAIICVENTFSTFSFHENDILLSFDTLIVPGVRRLSLGGTPADVESACNRLFDLFRTADSLNASRIIVDCSFDKTSGLGSALWNRVSKAASR